MFSFLVTKSYRKTYRMKISPEAYQKLGFENDNLPKDIDIRVGEDGDPRSARLGRHGILTSVEKVYTELSVEEGDTVYYDVRDYGTGKILQFNTPTPSKDTSKTEKIKFTVKQLKDRCRSNQIPVTGTKQELVDRLKEKDIPLEMPSKGDDCVWLRQSLRPIDFDRFKITNKDWSPNTEYDVYLAYMALKDTTGYSYCQGYTAELGRKLGYKPKGDKPDAIMIHDASNEYKMAEFKIYSSAFKSNHEKEDVDVLICWFDNENDRDLLPGDIVHLRELAKHAASSEFKDLEI